MILRDVLIPGKELKCNLCQWTWVSIDKKLPTVCANHDCRSREWNGKKQRRKPSLERIQLPKPARVRTIVSDDGDIDT